MGDVSQRTGAAAAPYSETKPSSGGEIDKKASGTDRANSPRISSRLTLRGSPPVLLPIPSKPCARRKSASSGVSTRSRPSPLREIAPRSVHVMCRQRLGERARKSRRGEMRRGVPGARRSDESRQGRGLARTNGALPQGWEEPEQRLTHRSGRCTSSEGCDEFKIIATAISSERASERGMCR